MRTNKSAETLSEISLNIGGQRYSSFSELEPSDRHTLFVLLSFLDPKNERRLVPFSFDEFCERCGLEKKSPEAAGALRFIKNILTGTVDATDLKTGEINQRPLFDSALIIERDDP